MKNPSGISSYDVRKYADLPEWHAMTVAISNLANAAKRAEIVGGQRDLAKAIKNAVHGVPYGDCCKSCNDLRTIYTPIVVEVQGDWVNGKYRCQRGHYWTCGYSLDAPWVMGD